MYGDFKITHTKLQKKAKSVTFDICIIFKHWNLKIEKNIVLITILEFSWKLVYGLGSGMQFPKGKLLCGHFDIKIYNELII